MNWILVMVIILIGGGAFLGWRAGLIKTVFSLVSTIAVLILTMIPTIILQPLMCGVGQR